MRRFLFILFSIFTFLPAQVNVDFGTDSVQCRLHVSQFQSNFNQYKPTKDINFLQAARASFEESLKICPRYSENNYVRARMMMEELLYAETSYPKKQLLINASFRFLDQQLAHFEGAERSNAGIIAGLKGRMLYQYLRFDESKQLVYEAIKEAIDWMQKSFVISKNDTDPFVLFYLFQAKFIAFQLPEDKKKIFKGIELDRQDLINQYLSFSTIISKKINALNDNTKIDPDLKKSEINSLKKIDLDLQNIFVKIADCANLEIIAKKALNTAPDQKEKWEEIMRLSKCHKGGYYIALAEEVCKKNDDLSCYGGLTLAYLDAKKKQKALENSQKIVLLCNGCDKAKEYKELSLQIALEVKRFDLARQYATDLGIDMNYIRSREIALQAADCEFAFEQRAAYWLAFDYLNKAIQKQIDPQTQKKWNDLLIYYKSFFPTNEELFNEGLQNKKGEIYNLRCFNNEAVKIRDR